MSDFIFGTPIMVKENGQVRIYYGSYKGKPMWRDKHRRLFTEDGYTGYMMTSEGELAVLDERWKEENK